MNAAEVDTVLCRALSADFDERGDDDTPGNDVDLAIEEMTDDERRHRRLNRLREAERCIIRGINSAVLTRDATVIGGKIVPGAQQIGIDELRTALKHIDRVLELEGE